MNQRLLRTLFCAAIGLLFLWRVSENTADNDLWGHVLYGQRMLALRGLEKSDPFSWTARGAPWINHEALAEVALGAAHRLAGGSGILLLMLVCGVAAFAGSLALGSRGLSWPDRAAAWAVAGLAANGIAYGFAPRPQMFTALALVAMLAVVRAVHHGRPAMALLLPPLFAAWINTHGGALAGATLLAAGAGASLLQAGWERRQRGGQGRAMDFRAAASLAAAVPLCFAAMLLNPRGGALVAWLARSVRWTRPEIPEWNPLALSAGNLPVWALMAAVAASWACSRRRRMLWEAAVLGLLACAAVRHARHVPLFCLAALALTPAHAAATARRFARHVTGLAAAARRPAVRTGLAALLAAAGLGALAGTLAGGKGNPLTIEVPRSLYPLAAVRFMREHAVYGNTLTFFDWGQVMLWELPRNPVSFDGRLDTVYPRAVIRAHWNFYAERPFDEQALDLSCAEAALLPADLPAVRHLVFARGWRAVYADPLAVVLVADPARFPALGGLDLPVEAMSEESVTGREPFPDEVPDLAREIGAARE